MDTVPACDARCEAMTLASTYSPAHRCLKRHGVRKVGDRYLCAHHREAVYRKK